MRRKIITLLIFVLAICQLEAKQTNDELTIIPIYASSENSTEFRSQSISADITGHTLTVEFKEDIGKAHVMITNSFGVCIDQETVTSTPDTITFNISDAGYYRMSIILVNGNQYYGYFRVEE